MFERTLGFRVCLGLSLCIGLLVVLFRLFPTPVPPQFTEKQRQNQAHVEAAMAQHRHDDARRSEQRRVQAMIQDAQHTRAKDLCRQAARTSARHPSTTSLSFLDVSSATADGPLLVQGTLHASNSFGLRLAHTMNCVVFKDKVQAIHIAEN